MSESFKKIKARVFASALVRSVLYGVLSGLVGASVFLLIVKRTLTDVNPLLCIPLGVLLAAAVGVVLFLVWRPTDKRVARFLDNNYSLDERVQTMVQFSSDTSDMAQIQREDTEKRLSSVTPRTFSVRHLWVSVVAAVLSVGIFITSLVIPSFAAPPPEPEEPIGDYEKTWRLARLADLIDMVEKSYMQTDLKDDVVASLNDLVEVVAGTDKESVMKSAAISTLLYVDGAVEDVNSSSEIAGQIKTSSVNEIVALGAAVEKMTRSHLLDALDGLVDYLEGDGFVSRISGFNSEIRAYLTNSGTSSEDPLYSGLYSLTTSLAQIADGGKSADIKDAFSDAEDVLYEVLLAQNDNRTVGDKVINELADIFGITNGDLETEEDAPVIGTPDEELDPPDREDEGLHEGGLGSGEVVFGSDDVIYDPDSDSYVKYGEVIMKYYAIILEQLVDGRFDAETEQAVNDYFASLFDGTESEND